MQSNIIYDKRFNEGIKAQKLYFQRFLLICITNTYRILYKISVGSSELIFSFIDFKQVVFAQIILQHR